MRNRLLLLLFFLLILLSRIPFLFDGYGVEEDSWGIAVAASNTLKTGVWEASRLPGHPVNEFFYLLFFPLGPVALNFLSALCSALMFFPLYGIFSLKGKQDAVVMSLGFLFIPVVYINSTCTLDYLWGMLFFTASIYFMLRERLMLAFILLALATGCRITYAAFILPLLFYCYQDFTWKFVKRLLLPVGVFVTLIILFYTPVFYVYGKSFFDYSDQFPYPSAAKVFYKAGIGVFGLPLFAFLPALIFFNRFTILHRSPGRFGWFLLIGMLLQACSYLALPQKSAYLMPAALLLWIALSKLSIPKLDRMLLVVALVSSFFFGVNVADANRGVGTESTGIRFHVNGQELTLELFRGHLLQDLAKRKNKTRFVKRVVAELRKQRQPMGLICGWWYNQILIEIQESAPVPKEVELVFYPDLILIKRWESEQRKVYHLPEQEVYAELNAGGYYFIEKSLLFCK